ncbi:MAG: LLM class flavin-dependent oxidoreductase [Deltaproteobacteria bacterium]|nr:LLM class flavin-dependent oxidoreductase [Deltaproteobacteria bacterium]
MPGVYPLESNEDYLRLGEQIGASAVWVPDHLLGIYHPELWADEPYAEVVPDPDGYFDPFCMLTALGQKTPITLGVAVTDSARRRAVDVARSALSVHHLCRGGMHLGVGCGEAESLLPFGYPFDKPVGRFEEFLRELRHILDTGEMPGGGCGRIGLPLESEHGKPKVWVAGHGPRMLRLTGQYGDGWLPAWRMSSAEYGEKKEIIARHAREADREPPISGLLAPMIMGESRAQLIEYFEKNPLSKLTALFIPGEVWEPYGIEHPAGRESRGLIDVIIHELDADELRALAPRIPIELLDDYYIVGGPTEMYDQLAAYRDAGCEHLVLSVVPSTVGGEEGIDRSVSALKDLLGRLAGD